MRGGSETVYDKLRRDWAEKFLNVDNNEGSSRAPVAHCDERGDEFEYQAPSFCSDLQLGWALHKARNQGVRFPDDVKQYLTRKFDLGERTGNKADPGKVAADMRTTRRPDGLRIFDRKDWLTKSQDLFWWYFLEKYQPSRNIQEMLFNRIAHNYVKMLFTAPVTKYRDKFLKRYPDLMAQAVYCTFCTAFPTSYKQFGDEFKEDLVQLIHEWIAGTKPVPRIWDKWNFKALEPKDMRKDEQIKQDASKGSLVSLPAELSEENLSKQSSLSSVGNKLSHKSLPLIIEEKAPNNGSFQASQGRDARRKSMAVRKGSHNTSVINTEELRDSVNRLAPHHVNEERASASSQSLSRLQAKVSSFNAFTGVQKSNRAEKRRESCPVGRGPEFSRCVFDVYGHSPLVEQFLRMQKLSKDSGTSVLIQRTEIKSLPPYPLKRLALSSLTDCALITPTLSAPTYREVIRKSLKISQALTSDFKKLDEENSHQRTLFTRKQKEANRDFTRREGELLSRHKDVKKISELIYLELTKDGDEQSSGKVAAAIASAMGYGAENETS
ncbi:hypothetical protein ACROYT_G037674 [Oculina patagonica]